MSAALPVVPLEYSTAPAYRPPASLGRPTIVLALAITLFEVYLVLPHGEGGYLRLSIILLQAALSLRCLLRHVHAAVRFAHPLDGRFHLAFTLYLTPLLLAMGEAGAWLSRV